MKGNNDKELKIIKDFITKINNGISKQKVNNDKLKHDLVKYLEKSLFGEDIESIEPEEKFEESVGERVKTKPRKTSASSRPSKIDSSKATADYLEYIEEQENGQKRFSDDYDSNGSGNVVSKAKGTGLKMLTEKQMLNRLPILLAQIQAGNNSIKLKNE